MASNLTLRVVISNDGTLCGRRHLSRDQREAICTDSYVKRRSAPMRILLALPIVVVAGCLASRLQSMQSQGTDSSVVGVALRSGGTPESDRVRAKRHHERYVRARGSESA